MKLIRSQSNSKTPCNSLQRCNTTRDLSACTEHISKQVTVCFHNESHKGIIDKPIEDNDISLGANSMANEMSLIILVEKCNQK